MQYKQRTVVMKRAREESGEDDASRAGGPSVVPSSIVIEPEERNQCQSSSSSPCTSDSDDGEEEEQRTSPPSSSASSACSGIYYNNSAVRFPTVEPGSTLPAVIIKLPSLHRVPNGRPLPCPPKLAIALGGGHHRTGSGGSGSGSTIAALMNAAISSSHCDYRKLHQAKGCVGTAGSPPSAANTVSPLLAPTNIKAKAKVGRAAGPPKKRAKRSVSFLLRSDDDERGEGSGESGDDLASFRLEGKGTSVSASRDLSEDQLLFVEAAASLRRSGRLQQPQQAPAPATPSQQRTAAGEVSREGVPPTFTPEVTASSSSSPLAAPATLKRALPPPPSSLQILATSRLV
jgi:hypothetical protein